MQSHYPGDRNRNPMTIWEGEVVEWSITAVLKTVELRGSGGSNPSLSAKGTKESAPSLLECGFFGLIDILGDKNAVIV